MNFSSNYIYHIYNQGNNKQTIFFTRQDYLIFLTLCRRLFPPVCSTIAWCLMPNHFHFMIFTDERCNEKIKQGSIYIDPITNNIRKLLSGYARIFNTRYHRTGSVFRQKTTAKCITEISRKNGNQFMAGDYYASCFHYVHQNPLKAGLVNRLQEWEFSSYKEYAGLSGGDICQKELAVEWCEFRPDNFIAISQQPVQEEVIKQFI